MNEKAISVVLACEIDLHVGYHLSFHRSPPLGVTYRTAAATHHFTGCEARLSPHEGYHSAEAVSVPTDMGDVVHTYYWPVLHRQAWVADFDECGYPFLSGRYTWHPDFQREFGDDWSSDFLARMRRRTVAMMKAYSHPSCKGMVFWSNYALNHAVALFDRLDLPKCAATVRQKGSVVYPAQTPLTQDRFACKWRDDRLRIVFCGRDYAMKNGQVALSVYRRLLASGYPLSLVYIGEIPPGPLERFGDVIESIEYYPAIDHR